VQEQLTAKGEHRSAGPVDLLVAATAEESGLVLLHHDRDFEAIARVTGQPVRMLELR
jgi:predicted nucleic acid-binding protein